MKRMLSEAKSEKLAQELKDLENARRRRAEEPLAQPLWHEAPSEDSPLSPGRRGCPPNAGECTGRTQIFGPPPSNASRPPRGDSPTLTTAPEPASESRNRVGA